MDLVGSIRLHRLYQRIELLVGRETTQFLLGKFQLAIDRDLEHAAARAHVGDLGVRYLCEPCSRTESTRLIVSDHAVFDDDLHSSSNP